MKTDLKVLLAEKAILAIRAEQSDISLADLRKSLSRAYGMISKELKDSQNNTDSTD